MPAGGGHWALHTSSAANTINRILDVFPANQQKQVKIQLAQILKGVVCQQLVNSVEGGQMAVFEVMTVNPAVQNLIRDGRTHQIDNVIFGGTDRTMMSMDAELQRMVRAGRVTRDMALMYASNPETLGKRI